MPSTNIESRRAASRRYYQNNKRRLNMKHKEYNKRNIKELAKYHIDYVANNKDKVNSYMRSDKVQWKVFKSRCDHGYLKIRINYTQFCRMRNENCAFCGQPPTHSTSRGFCRVNNMKSFNYKNCLPCCISCLKSINKMQLKNILIPNRHRVRLDKIIMIREGVLDAAIDGRIKL